MSNRSVFSPRQIKAAFIFLIGTAAVFAFMWLQVRDESRERGRELDDAGFRILMLCDGMQDEVSGIRVGAAERQNPGGLRELVERIQPKLDACVPKREWLPQVDPSAEDDVLRRWLDAARDALERARQREWDVRGHRATYYFRRRKSDQSIRDRWQI